MKCLIHNYLKEKDVIIDVRVKTSYSQHLCTIYTADFFMSLCFKFQFFFNEDFKLGISFLKHLFVRIDHLISMIRLHSSWLKINK